MVAAATLGHGTAVLGGMADLHVHTTHSDGVDRPDAMVEHALGSCDLDLVAITDHDTIGGALLAAQYAASRGWADRVVMGEEVSAREGHVLGLFLSSLVTPGLSAAETIEKIRAQGGLAIAAHPYWRCLQARPMGVGSLIGDLPFDAVEVANGGLLPEMWFANRKAEAACRRLGVAAVGGSDAHVKEAIGWCRTAFSGSTAVDLRLALIGGRVQPERVRKGAVGIARYIAWGIARSPKADSAMTERCV